MSAGRNAEVRRLNASRNAEVRRMSAEVRGMRAEIGKFQLRLFILPSAFILLHFFLPSCRLFSWPV
jgi:hypothetical protein